MYLASKQDEHSQSCLESINTFSFNVCYAMFQAKHCILHLALAMKIFISNDGII